MEKQHLELGVHGTIPGLTQNYWGAFTKVLTLLASVFPSVKRWQTVLSLLHLEHLGKAETWLCKPKSPLPTMGYEKFLL